MKPKEKLFKPWSTKVAAFEYDKDKSFFDLMVPTADTTKHSYVLEACLSGQKPVFFTGDSGVGKSAIIQNLIDRLKQDSLQPININMSAQTSSARTQASIQDKLEKKKRTVLGALPGKKIAIFIDDINMPAPEEWGAAPPIELLRLFVDRGGLYTRGDWEWRDVEDTTMIACSAPPGGGRNDLTPRFTRIFNMICLPQPSEAVLTDIFGQILQNFLNTGFPDKVKNLKDGAIQSTIEIYTRIQTEMRPTPDRFHYQFNLRDVSKVI
jgi:dynein heavy chain